MRNFTLIGHPIGHSMSPMIHDKLFKLSGRIEDTAPYTLTDIHPDDLASSGAFLRSLKGFNVTIPHKTEIIPLLDELAESALRYNSVNCVLNEGGKLIGHNTDCDGFTLSAKMLPLDGKVVILGCGGVGRMMAIEAALKGASLTIAVRSDDVLIAQKLMAEILAKCSGVSVRICDIGNIEGKYDLLVNATPLGMFPNVDRCPVSDSVIENCSTFFDAIYNPTDTTLIAKARAMGKPAVGGAAMLVYQAVKAHEIWDGDLYTPEQISPIITDVEAAVLAMQQK